MGDWTNSLQRQNFLACIDSKCMELIKLALEKHEERVKLISLISASKEGEWRSNLVDKLKVCDQHLYNYTDDIVTLMTTHIKYFCWEYGVKYVCTKISKSTKTMRLLLVEMGHIKVDLRNGQVEGISFMSM